MKSVEKLLDTKLRELLSHPDKAVRKKAEEILKILLGEHEAQMFPTVEQMRVMLTTVARFRA
jgi:hypothetical protein